MLAAFLHRSPAPQLSLPLFGSQFFNHYQCKHGKAGREGLIRVSNIDLH